jgi:hypothetical protein
LDGTKKKASLTPLLKGNERRTASKVEHVDKELIRFYPAGVQR